MIILNKNEMKVRRFKIKMFHHLSVKEYENTVENNKLISKLKEQYGEDNVKKVWVRE